MFTEKNILEALGKVIHPAKNKDVVTLGMVSSITSDDSGISITLEPEKSNDPFISSLKSSVVKILKEELGSDAVIKEIRIEPKVIVGKKEEKPRDYTKPVELITVAVGTSIDAFAVGISFALLDIRIWLSGIIIGAVTFLASMTAIRIGKSAGKKLGQRVEIAGGLILIAIGMKIFLEHMLGI